MRNETEICAELCVDDAGKAKVLDMSSTPISERPSETS